MIDYIIYAIIFIYGVLIGSFLNVCIYRIPEESSVVSGRSHCMSCNTKLKWYDLIPLLSYIFLRGRCRSCKAKISIQYPMIEALNGMIYVLVFYIFGWVNPLVIAQNIIYSLVLSALLVLSVIDFRTKTIPFGINVFILLMGLAEVILQIIYDGWNKSILLDHGIGLIAVSGFLFIIFCVTGGRGVGGGDIKLMAAAGLLLGWKLIILAFLIGCILASVIHPIRMKLNNLNRELAFGPYLSVGIGIAMLFGSIIINWYLEQFIL